MGGDKEAGIKEVLVFIAGQPLTGQDQLVIKKRVHPNMRWPDFFALINQLVLDGFLKPIQRAAEGNRQATFYRLTPHGWDALRGDDQPN